MAKQSSLDDMGLDLGNISILFGSIWDPWHFGADADPHRWLMDPDPDPDPDPTPFFSDFKDAKKIFFSKNFSYNLPAGTLAHCHQS